jgi:hypothetical protein
MPQIKLLLEFPIRILDSYHGASNLDVTVDEDILDALAVGLCEAGIEYEVTGIAWQLEPVPGVSEPFLTIGLQIESDAPEMVAQAIFEALRKTDRAGGLCIRQERKWGPKVLHFDGQVADIALKRQFREMGK